jgi:hypothetical protein
MQEKRKKKAQGASGKVALPGELGSEERAAKEAEAAEAAAQLLRELELEAAAKAAKAAKKKKKGTWRERYMNLNCVHAATRVTAKFWGG